ncbi:hypothetical protein PAXRUDRAFT_220878 [Paxillus rubicundulus Ve08.2h10]|uniref:Uncharacterized protein n=1 Tax=Paxillus rubicundulus Ve08.2h10 TaxID=930991 RepID=A0A0D0CYP0_9AGAM|nr:hypothetical protein PAXRUDRAFT_220878 [Paxillus rubicundulus Ve08.2h10]
MRWGSYQPKCMLLAHNFHDALDFGGPNRMHYEQFNCNSQNCYRGGEHDRAIVVRFRAHSLPIQLPPTDRLDGEAQPSIRRTSIRKFQQSDNIETSTLAALQRQLNLDVSDVACIGVPEYISRKNRRILGYDEDPGGIVVVIGFIHSYS